MAEENENAHVEPVLAVKLFFCFFSCILVFVGICCIMVRLYDN